MNIPAAPSSEETVLFINASAAPQVCRGTDTHKQPPCSGEHGHGAEGKSAQLIPVSTKVWLLRLFFSPPWRRLWEVVSAVPGSPWSCQSPAPFAGGSVGLGAAPVHRSRREQGSRPRGRDSHPQEGTSSSHPAGQELLGEGGARSSHRARVGKCGRGETSVNLRARGSEPRIRAPPSETPTPNRGAQGTGTSSSPAASPQSPAETHNPQTRRNSPRFPGKLCLHTCGSPWLCGSRGPGAAARVGAAGRGGDAAPPAPLENPKNLENRFASSFLIAFFLRDPNPPQETGGGKAQL